jgi:ketosteroid isomerase-like protein
MARPVRFPPGSVPPAGLYRSTGSGRIRFFDGGSPLPGGVNSSSWQQVSDHYRVVESAPDPLARHVAVTDVHHGVRFAAGTVVSPGEYRNAASGAVRYFDGATPLPGGVNGSSWQQVSDHYHAHTERSEHDRRPLIDFPTPPRRLEPVGATAVLEAAPPVSPPAPSAPAAPRNAGELAVELIRRLNDGEDAVAELFAPDAHLFLPVGSLLICHRGHLQLRRLLDWLHANLEEHTLSIERVSGIETNVTVDFDTRGRGMSGEHFDRPGAMIVEARDGRIRMVHIAIGERRAA